MITNNGIRVWDTNSLSTPISNGVRVWSQPLDLTAPVGGGGSGASATDATIRLLPSHAARLFPNASAIRQVFKP